MSGSLFPSDQSGVFWLIVGMIGMVLLGVTVTVIMDGDLDSLSGPPSFGDEADAHAERRMASLAAELEHLQERERSRSERQETSAELGEAITRLARRTVEIEELGAAIEIQREAITARGEEFNAYQIAYRDQVWRDAAQRRMDELVCRDGQTYREVVLSRVTGEGISIRHAAGAAKIPVRLLPKDLREELLLDLVESQRLLKERRAAELAEIQRRREARAPRLRPAPTPKREVVRNRIKGERAKADPKDRVEILSLREQIAGMAARLSQLNGELSDARLRASGMGKRRSPPGSLETWGERVQRLSRVKTRAETQLALLRGRLREIDPTYRPEEGR